MEDNFSNAYFEVLEILKYMPKESVNKIPQNILNTFETKKNKNHNFKVDINKSFEEQEILEETKDIFANIFRDYWATEYQKERINAKQNYDRRVLEERKREKYNPDNLFKNKIKEDYVQTNIEKENNNLPVKYNETLYQKFIGWIKRLFNYKKQN